MSNEVTRDELEKMVKRLRKVLKSNKKTIKNFNTEKGKEYGKPPKDKRKGTSKCKKIECYNCEGVGHYATECTSPKDIKKSMQATWSDTESEKSESSSSFDEARYDQKDFLAFIASNNFVCDNEKIHDDLHVDNTSKSGCEIDVDYIENLANEHQNLINKFMKNLDVLDAQKAKINSLDEEKKKKIGKNSIS